MPYMPADLAPQSSNIQVPMNLALIPERVAVLKAIVKTGFVTGSKKETTSVQEAQGQGRGIRLRVFYF
jgi:hypothetical protein